MTLQFKSRGQQPYFNVIFTMVGCKMAAQHCTQGVVFVVFMLKRRKAGLDDTRPANR